MLKGGPIEQIIKKEKSLPATANNGRSTKFGMSSSLTNSVQIFESSSTGDDVFTKEKPESPVRKNKYSEANQYCVLGHSGQRRILDVTE